MVYVIFVRQYVVAMSLTLFKIRSDSVVKVLCYKSEGR